MGTNIPSHMIVRQEKGSWLKRSYAFLDNETPLATLRYDNSQGNKARAVVAGKEFLIRRRGFWKYYLTITSSSTQSEIQIHLNWRGGMKITDAENKHYVFKSTGLWRPRWRWLDGQERIIIEIRSNQFSRKNRGVVEIKYPEMKDPLFWIVVSWFVIVCGESDGVAAAVT